MHIVTWSILTATSRLWQLRLLDPIYFCENLNLYILVLLLFILCDGDISSQM